MRPIDWIAMWFAVMGMWPIADPGHDVDEPLAVIDLLLHGAGFGLLMSRWKVVRR